MAKYWLTRGQEVFCGLLVGLTLPISMVASAEPAVVYIGLDSRFSDNVAKVKNNKESDLESRVYLGVRHTSDPGACKSDFAAQAAYRHWLDDTFSPETSAEMDFQGDCRLGANLIWQASNYLRDVAQDRRVSGTPNDRTQKNVFRTGPVLTLRLNAVDELVLSAAYEDTEFREPEQTDGERVSGSLSWNHLFDPSFTAGLSAAIDRSELDTEEEIDRVTLGVPFTKTWALTALSGSIGYGQIETSLRDRPAEEYNTFVANLIAARQVNQTTEVELEASRELTDQTSDFDSRFEDFVFDLEQTSAVEVTAIRLGVGKDFGGTARLDLGFFGNRSDYLDTGAEEDVIGADVNYRRPITGQLTTTMAARYEYQTFSQDDSDDELLRVSAGLEFRLNPQLDVISRVGFEQRTSEEVSREFEEGWVLVGVQYQFR